MSLCLIFLILLTSTIFGIVINLMLLYDKQKRILRITLFLTAMVLFNLNRSNTVKLLLNSVFGVLIGLMFDKKILEWLKKRLFGGN